MPCAQLFGSTLIHRPLLWRYSSQPTQVLAFELGRVSSSMMSAD